MSREPSSLSLPRGAGCLAETCLSRARVVPVWWCCVGEWGVWIQQKRPSRVWTGGRYVEPMRLVTCSFFRAVVDSRELGCDSGGTRRGAVRIGEG